MSKAAHGLVLVPSLLFAATVLAGAPAEVFGYLDSARTADERAHDLVRRMTLDEKSSQMQNHTVAIPRLQVPAYNWWSEALHGVASVRASATVFPEPIGLAASFDPALVGRMGDVIATEGRIRHRESLSVGSDLLFAGLTFFSPNIPVPRPALGPRPGDLRRGSAAHGAHGRGLHPRPARR